MTAKELAALIDGRESGMELTAEEERQAEESGLLALYMPDASLTLLSGAVKGSVYDPHSGYCITRDGLFPHCDCKSTDSCPLARIALQNAVEVSAEYHVRGPEIYCKFDSETPHETFRTYVGNGAEAYCVGLVFRLEDLPGYYPGTQRPAG